MIRCRKLQSLKINKQTFLFGSPLDFSFLLLPLFLIVFVVANYLSHCDTDETFELEFPFERICNAIPLVVTGSRWELVKADENTGHFEVKISLLSGLLLRLTMSIDVGRINSSSSKLLVHCSSNHQLADRGRGRTAIDVLRSRLLKQLESPEN